MKPIGVAMSLLVLVPLACGQSFNIDVGVMTPGLPGTGVPAPEFGAAAHQPGTWNDVPASSIGKFPLVGLDGTLTGVVCSRTVAGGVLASDNPMTSGDFQALLDDANHTGGRSSESYSFYGLAAGRYVVTTYAWSPLASGDLTNVIVVGSTSVNGQLVGGLLVGPDAFTYGITHAVHVVEVTDGQLLEVICEGRLGGATVSGFQISGEYRFMLSQPAGGGNLTVLDCGGAPGSLYINLVTANQGNYPNGWVFGIDISLADALIEIAAGPPFYGTLDDEGSMTYVVPSPFPAGLVLFCVGLEVDPSGPVCSVAGPFTYTLQ